MSEARNIVIVGLSIAGLNAAHYLLKHVIPSLNASEPSEAHRLVLVDQSSKFYWKIGAPRALVSTELVPHSKTFLPFEDGFTQYPSNSYTIVQGTATSLDTAASIFTYTTPSGTLKNLSYHAIIIATGTSTPTPLTSLQDEFTTTQSALDTMNSRLAHAKHIVISGGGPIGVETAGEIGEALNGAASIFARRPAQQNARVTLVAGGPKLLPLLRQSLSDKAEQFLNRVGVDVLYNARVERTELSDADAAHVSATGEKGVESSRTAGPKTRVYLRDGQVLEADVYIPASGSAPNSSWIPRQFLNNAGYVKVDPHLRVTGAGDRVFCIGDVSDYMKGAPSVFAAVPVLGNNLALDLQKVKGLPSKLQDKELKLDTRETQAVPVGRSKGVGAMKGLALPSIVVWAFKGRDMMMSMIGGTTHGTKW